MGGRGYVEEWLKGGIVFFVLNPVHYNVSFDFRTPFYLFPPNTHINRFATQLRRDPRPW
jgi:hypothetical protein